MPSQLEQLQAYTTIVADSAEFRLLASYAPRDARCGRRAILAALGQPAYAPLLTQTLAAHRGQPLDAVADRVLVRFGCELLDVVPGRVATEVDARLAFDTAATIACAMRLVDLYASEGIPRERVLLDVAATWEGIQASRALAHHGIHCCLTLVHTLCQSVAAAEAGVGGVAPVVEQPEGALVAAQTWRYFKKFGIETAVRASGFTEAATALALAGCDQLALMPHVMAQLQASDAVVTPALDVEEARSGGTHAASFNEPSFRFSLNEDERATQRLAAGVRDLASAARALERLIRST